MISIFYLCIYFHSVLMVLSEETDILQERIVRFGDDIKLLRLPSDQNDIDSDAVAKIQNMVKSQILSKLHLVAAPSPSVSTPRPSPEMIKILLNETEQHPVRIPPPEEEQRIILYATNDGFECKSKNSTNCRMFQFKLPSNLTSFEADIWVYKENTRLSELSVSGFFSNSSSEDYQKQWEQNDYIDENSALKNWVKFELPKVPDEVAESDSSFCTVEVNGLNIEQNVSQRPFLLITKFPAERNRMRRDINCQTTTTYSCCLIPFRVYFSDIGWDDFIYEPKFVDVNFCKGECWKDRSKFPSDYLRALAALFESNSSIADQLGTCFAPSCRPSAMESMDIIHIDNDGNLLHQKLLNMIVKSCACG